MFGFFLDLFWGDESFFGFLGSVFLSFLDVCFPYCAFFVRFFDGFWAFFCDLFYLFCCVLTVFLACLLMVYPFLCFCLVFWELVFLTCFLGGSWPFFFWHVAFIVYRVFRCFAFVYS